MNEMKWLDEGMGIGMFRTLTDEMTEKWLQLSMDLTDAVGRPGITEDGAVNVKKSTDVSFHTEGWNVPGLRAEELREIGFDLNELDAALCGGLQSLFEAYAKSWPLYLFDAHVFDTGYLIQRYAEGAGGYGDHVDSTPRACSNRILATVTYLNEVPVSGSTFFTRLDLEVRPAPGWTLAFPASWMYRHGSATPVGSDKYIVSSFINVDPRQMTFDNP